MEANNSTPQSTKHLNLEIVKEIKPGFDEILTKDALEFLEAVISRFSVRIDDLLDARYEQQKRIDQKELPTFPEETKQIREGDWKVNPLPDDLLDRRVEITGPVDRKMIINALNSGANVFMADFEDSNSPTWSNIIQGQINLRDAVRGTISYVKPDGSKSYSLNDQTAVLMVRPRGLHLKEDGILYNNQPIPGALVDFSLYFYHNVKELIDQGTGPYFYIPKLQHYLEARLWNDIFNFAQDYMDVSRGTIKATVLLEHILAAFQMDEILYELREHSAGLNSGRWDYIFSFIKTFSKFPEFVLPDRSQVSMDRHFLKSYVTHLIKVCHNRGVHAMGGMAAQIPIKNDPKRNAEALEKVRQDKLREVKAGHDGTWVAHPGLIQIARDVFDTHMPDPNQLKIIPDVDISATDLLEVPSGTITENGTRINLNVGVRYLASWLAGNGCVPIFHLMEDAATAEISRTQLWQWLHHEVKLDDGRTITQGLLKEFLEEEMEKIKDDIGIEFYNQSEFEKAKSVFWEIITEEELPEFLTLVAYKQLAQE